MILTSNRTRDVHDALRRRCLYHWIPFPPADRVAEIVRRRVPGSSERLALGTAYAVSQLRELRLQKHPGIAEAVDWAAALAALGVDRFEAVL